MITPIQDIECPKCHRIDFGQRVHCESCGWTIRPTPVDGKPWGFDVLIEIRTGMAGTAKEVRHYKGSEATARRRVVAVPNYVRVLAVVPLSETQWLNAYGEGRL